MGIRVNQDSEGWPFGSSEGKASLGMPVTRRVPYRLKPLGPQMLPGGRLLAEPSRLYDSGSNCGDCDGDDIVASLEGLGVTAPSSGAPTGVISPYPISGGPQLKVGPFSFPLVRLTEGNVATTMTTNMVRLATGADGKPLPGVAGTAANIMREVWLRFADLSTDYCRSLGGIFGSGALCTSSYKGLGPFVVNGKQVALYPYAMDGKVPLFRFKHPTKTSETWGIYFNVVQRTDGTHDFQFIVRKVDPGFWSKLWGWIKEFVAVLINFLGDLLRDLAAGLCSVGQQFLQGLAQVPDRQRAGGQWTDAEMKILSDSQRMALASGQMQAQAAVGIAQIVAKNLCQYVPTSSGGLPPPPESTGGGLVIVVGIAAAASLFFILR